MGNSTTGAICAIKTKDRKSTRLNSSHLVISYAVFCLKKKIHTKRQTLFHDLDAVIHLLMEAKHWGLRTSRNATSINIRLNSLESRQGDLLSVTFRTTI